MEEGNKEVRREIKPAWCVIGHGVQFARVVENWWSDHVVSVVSRVDAKEIGDGAVDGGGFPEGPSDSGSIISAHCGGPPGRISADLREDQLLQDQGR